MRNKTGKQVGAEAEAKAALVQYLRATGRMVRGAAIALELGIAKQSNRADAALITNKLELFEIKTRNDNLSRLDSQLESYGKVADFVTVVAATNHISVIISKVADHIGILEIISFEDTCQIRLVRDAKISPSWKPADALQLIPASEIRERLLGGTGPKNRADVILQAASLPPELQREAVVKFLRDRYRASTQAFLRLVRKRNAKPRDLAALHIWKQINLQSPLNMNIPIDFNDDYITFVGKCFGPIPDDVKNLLNA